jgi:hypothetical protein
MTTMNYNPCGKPDAGNPHVRLGGRAVASGRPRRGAPLCKRMAVAVSSLAILMSTARAVDTTVWTWDDGGRVVEEPATATQTQNQGIIAWLPVWQILTGVSVSTSALGTLLFIL